jgi:hypothetical protein
MRGVSKTDQGGYSARYTIRDDHNGCELHIDHVKHVQKRRPCIVPPPRALGSAMYVPLIARGDVVCSC